MPPTELIADLALFIYSSLNFSLFITLSTNGFIALYQRLGNQHKDMASAKANG